jgi:Mrp family chromosome partitioning ATPase
MKDNKKETNIELSRDEVFDVSPGSSVVHNTSEVPLSIIEHEPDYLDEQVIHQRYFNNFNFSKLSQRFDKLNVTLGITSANAGEGKTLVASNMAVSLAQAYQQRTVLVDLNFKNPQLHRIFGTAQAPGLSEAFENRMLKVSPTKIDELYLLSAGDVQRYKPSIKDTLPLREILATLKKEFDFIIVDMSSVLPIEGFPVHFINEMDGLVAVIDTKSTRQEHLDKVFKHIDENRVIGYILNKIED